MREPDEIYNESDVIIIFLVALEQSSNERMPCSLSHIESVIRFLLKCFVKKIDGIE